MDAIDAAAAPETMMLTYKYRLNPERRQHRALERILEQQRQLYIAALAERIGCYEKTGRSISEVEQSRSLTEIRRDDTEFSGVQRRIQQATLKRLDRAYKAFFRRAKAGAGAASGFPKFPGFEHWDGFAFDAFLQVKWDGRQLRFAGMPGGLRVHLDRPIPGAIKGLWFKREGGPGRGGRWFCGFQAETPIDARRRGCGSGDIGVDWGTSVLAALSSGEMIANPRHGEALAQDLARAQRAVSRKKKGSKSRRKARAHLQAVNRHIANRRRNTMDKVAKRLVTHFGLVAMEGFSAKSLVNAERAGEALPQFIKTRRNREALDAAPFMLRQMVEYKARRHGAHQVIVASKHTTQECFWCGGLHFKDLTEAVHVCTAPGLYFNKPVPRKVNAARVILKRARASGSAPERGHKNLAVEQSAADDRGGPVPGGVAQATNLSAGSGCLGNTEGGQPPPGRRAALALPIPHPRSGLSESGKAQAPSPRPRRTSGW